MAYQITNVSGVLYDSADFDLAAGASVILNVPVLPTYLAVPLQAGTLKAYHIADAPLFQFEWSGFTDRAVGLSTTTQYVPLQGQNCTPNAAATQYVISNGKKRLYSLLINIATAPGASKSRVFTVWKNGVATALTVTFANTENGTKRVTLLVEAADLDQLQLKCEAVNTPVATQCSWALVLSNSDALYA